MRQAGCRPVRDLLAEYQAGLLTERQRAEVAAHLRECGPCARELAALERTAGLLSGVEPRRPARDLWPGIAGRLADRRVRHSWWAPLVPTRRAWYVVGAALLVLAVVFVGVLARSPHSAVSGPATHLVAETDAEAPTYAHWHAEASMTSALADRYALAVVLSSKTAEPREASPQ